MSAFKIKKIIDKPSLGHFSFASPRSPSYGVTACFARLFLFSIMLFGIDGCNLILYMLIKLTFRKGAVVGLLLKLCLLATEEKDEEEGTPGKAQCADVRCHSTMSGEQGSYYLGGSVSFPREKFQKNVRKGLSGGASYCRVQFRWLKGAVMKVRSPLGKAEMENGWGMG